MNMYPGRETNALTKEIFNSMASTRFVSSLTHPLNERGVYNDAIPVDECITVLKCRRGEIERQVVIVGTAHISEESANQVRRVIQKVKPAVVMVELDARRLNTFDEVTVLGTMFDVPPREAENLDKAKKRILHAHYRALSWIESIIYYVGGLVKRSASFLLAYKFASLYKSLEQLGFKAGGEFQAAAEEAKALNASILLGDQDFEITMQRLAASLATTDSHK